MDASAVRRMILSFEKKSLKNQEMRTKFPDNPERSVVTKTLTVTDVYIN